MTKLVIFDLDGTLLNTIEDLGRACNHALAQCGFPVRRSDEYNMMVIKMKDKKMLSIVLVITAIGLWMSI